MEGDFALAGLRSLGLTVIEFGKESIKHFVDKSASPHPRHLTLVDKGVKDPQKDNGIFFQNGNLMGIQDFTLGETQRTSPFLGVVHMKAEVFVKTIANFFHVNTWPEKKSKTIKWGPVLTRRGAEIYVVVFDGTDVSGDGKVGTVNPFDLMAPFPSSGSPTVSNNAPYDGVIFSLSQTELLERTTRHEAGHAVSIPHNNKKGVSSVMREWIGPVLVDRFAADDKARMDL